MNLSTLFDLANIPFNGSNGNMTVSGIAIDSRTVKANYVFIAIEGSTQDGHEYIDSAIKAGAIAVVVQKAANYNEESVDLIKVSDSAKAAGLIASAYYGAPSEKVKLVGITGTNGKTTTVTLLHQLFSLMGIRAGLISTVENIIGTEVIPSTHTTPDPVSLNELLAKMADGGCDYVFMEVSSHAAHQQRISGLRFEGGVFTNMSHDHLDYHNTFDEYIAAKKSFFDGLRGESFALVNIDDKRGMVMLQNTKAKQYTYSIRKSADFKGKIFENTLEGLEMEIDQVHVHLRLIGEFNAYNVVCAYGVASLLGFSKTGILTGLSALAGARGRFETIRDINRGVLYIVDYAHTPDALEKVLKTIHAMVTKQASLISVVGCGGNRDGAKRPVMGGLAAKWSKEAIFTDDNPRKEDPVSITDAMQSGVAADDREKVLIINDRKQAIHTAFRLAKKGDIVLVAGKGHETYQEINGVKHDFDDRKVIEDIIGN
ncbi:MAG: UDP-N-acetylmuramoyl-L-alanyl-D-glutamate--2,6-diaminopimelate ligase [Saprospiraceae bacterium]